MRIFIFQGGSYIYIVTIIDYGREQCKTKKKNLLQMMRQERSNRETLMQFSQKLVHPELQKPVHPHQL